MTKKTADNGKKMSSTRRGSSSLPTPKGKRLIWLKYFLDESNPKTFLNNTESAIAAGYKCSSRKGFMEMGCQNASILKKHIGLWINESGLGEIQLKKKLISLTQAKGVVFQKVKGHVDAESLPDGTSIVTESHKLAWNQSSGDVSEAYDDGETVVAITVDSLETQRRSLDMAMKVKGMYAPVSVEQKTEVKGDLTVSMAGKLTSTLSEAELGVLMKLTTSESEDDESGPE